MTKIRFTILLLLLFAPLAFSEDAAPPSKPPFELANASPSADDLVSRYVAALRNDDNDALQSLRVTEREYREIIAPGTVAPGRPPRQTREEVMTFFWSMLNSKSNDLSRELLKAYGGKKFEVVKVDFIRGDKEYAWYRAVGEPRIRVRNDEGKEAVVPGGYIAEVAGRYKFIGLNWED